MDLAVAEGFKGKPPVRSDFKQHILRNTEVFSAFKVHRLQKDVAAQMLDSEGNLKIFEQFAEDVKGITNHQCRTWLRTEYDMTIKRAAFAADWQRFEEEKDVLPNLRWVPSTAAEPGADHKVFWNTVRPIDDPFWSDHFPGDRWGCQCSLESSDEPTTDIPEAGPKDRPSAGLDVNPGTNGEIFSEKHPYFPDKCQSCPFYKENHKEGFTNLSKEDCAKCSGIEDVLSMLKEKRNEETLSPHMIERLQQYWELSKDPDYVNVEFNEENGGIKATHIGHNFDKHGGKYEIDVQTAGYDSGHSVILGNEMNGGFGERFVEGTWDGLKFEVAGRLSGTVNNILSGLSHCASKRITEVAVIDFPKANFNQDTFTEALRRYRLLENSNPKQFLRFKRIVCVQEQKIILNIEF